MVSAALAALRLHYPAAAARVATWEIVGPRCIAHDVDGRTVAVVRVEPGLLWGWNAVVTAVDA